jgi:hypothetical protein
MLFSRRYMLMKPSIGTGKVPDFEQLVRTLD